MRVLIRGVAVWPRQEAALIPKADVVIEGRRFAALLTGEKPQGPFDLVVEGEGRLLLPGFVNAHTHLAMTLFRGLAQDRPLRQWLTEEVWPREKRLTAEVVHWFALLGLAEMIRSGTTAFADMYFFMEEVAEAVEQAGVRALLAYGVIAPTPERVEPELKKAEEFAREWDGRAEGRIRVALAPHAPYTCGPEVWKRAVALARELRLPLHTHLAETREEVEEVRARTGRSPVEWLEELGVFGVPVLAAHCVHLSEKDMEILAAHGVHAVHCPTSNLKLACGIAPVAEMLRTGVNVCLGTDGAGSAGDLNMVEEMRLAALLAKVRTGDPQALSAREALGLATWRGAVALGWGKEVGTIEVGRRADGILLRLDRVHLFPDYDPIANVVYAGQAADVEAVFVDGRFLLRDGQLQTLDEEEILGRCRELAKKFR
ncbi:MAG: amidohydrolase [Candidatus Bipolaricaulota bacterium]|nr:amidohydrolase [Candidatus Bipolaricaulota bacterium]MDW8151947.1 amidohydrolase [Candidatus Bipolaricaulota bacterium]